MMTRHLLTDWLRRRRTATTPLVVQPEAPRPRADTGEYRLIYKYLRDRFADRIVLTFSEMEDLLGFSLPESARLDKEWWGVAAGAADRTAQSDSWTLAGRTATVNLSAQNVLFERDTSR